MLPTIFAIGFMWQARVASFVLFSVLSIFTTILPFRESLANTAQSCGNIAEFFIFYIGIMNTTYTSTGADDVAFSVLSLLLFIGVSLFIAYTIVFKNRIFFLRIVKSVDHVTMLN